MNIFNRQSVRHHRDRAAASYADFNFLFQEVAARLGDRLQDITRTFPITLDLGCHGGDMAAHIPDRSAVETLINSDLSPKMAELAYAKNGAASLTSDEEFLPFKEQSLDLVVSNLSLHWVNDLPGAFTQIRRALKPDGLFLAAMLGGETLNELGEALRDAEIEIEGGLSPRLSPFAEIKDAGNLLGRAGFALPVADTETITVSYGNPLKLMTDLRGMGETNSNMHRRTTFSRRATLKRAAEIYAKKFMNDESRMPATFEIIYLTAWVPHESQQKPLSPGSGQVSLGNVFMDDAL
ncbi:MAG: methyltransferase domain-containing protein [Rhodospirillales bacterium]